MKARLLSLLAVAATTIATAQPLHLTKALELVRDLTALQAAGVFTDSAGVSLNRYGGSWGSASDPSYVHFTDLAAGTAPGNNTRCAPLLTHLLKDLHGRDWRQFSFTDPLTNTTKTSASPAPYQYIALTKAGQGLVRIPRLADAEPGDLLHWWQVGTADSDHSMIIVAIDWASAKAYPSDHSQADPTLAGTTYYEVRVVDSSASVHTNDSRLVAVNGATVQIPGIGTGTIGLLVNTDGELVAYTWSLPTSDYATKRTGWLSGLHTRLRRLPAYEAVISRYQP